MSNVFLVTRAALIFSTALTCIDSNFQGSHAASTSEIFKKEDAFESSLLRRTLVAEKHRVLTHTQTLSDERVAPSDDQERTFSLKEEDKLFLEKLKDQKYVSDFLATPDVKTRQYNLVLSILGISEEDLFTYDEAGEIDWISAIRKVNSIPLESLNFDAARLLVSDFLIHNEHFALPIFSIIFGKLFHTAQLIDEGILQKDDIERCLLTCHRRNLNIHTQWLEEELSDFEFNTKKRDMINLYAEHIVRLADKGGKNAQEYVLSFFNKSLKFKTLDEIWRDMASKIPGQNSDVCPDEESLFMVLKENASNITPDLQRRIITQFKNFQLRKAIIQGILKVHGPSTDFTLHYGLSNTYALILTSLWDIENSFLRHYHEYREQNRILEEHGNKESKIQGFLSNTRPDAQAALHNFLAVPTINILQSVQKYSEDAATNLKNLEGQEIVFRSFSHLVSPYIQSESAKFLLTVYDARLMRDLHKRYYGKPYVLYQGNDIVSGEVTQMLPFYMNPNWKLAEVTGILRDELFDQGKALDFIHLYAHQGYLEAQEALARFSKLVGQIESKEKTESDEMQTAPQEVSLEQLFVLYNAQLIH